MAQNPAARKAARAAKRKMVVAAKRKLEMAANSPAARIRQAAKLPDGSGPGALRPGAVNTGVLAFERMVKFDDDDDDDDVLDVEPLEEESSAA